MPVLNPDHLLDQARRLAAPFQPGPPRQVDLRRAISSAYYAIFHLVITAAADEIVGASLNASREYALVMRSIDHRTIKSVCLGISKPTPPASFRTYLPVSGFDAAMLTFAATFPDLQDQRHSADYDSLTRYTASDATVVIGIADQMLALWKAAPVSDRKAFLYLLLFPPKR